MIRCIIIWANSSPGERFDTMCLLSSRVRLFDMMGVGMSFACLIHCLALPLLLMLAPELSAWLSLPAAFHAAILMLAEPAVLAALTARTRPRLNYSNSYVT